MHADESSIQGEIELRRGEGRISGYLSALLGLASLGAVACFHFPELTTTAELRKSYDVEFLRSILYWTIVAASVLGALNFLFVHGRGAAVIGLTTSAVAVLAGGSAIESSGQPSSPYAIGLDWLILGLLVSALIFIPIEKAIPHTEQRVLRRQWKTDLHYFALTHLLVSYLLILTVDTMPPLLDGVSFAPLRDAVRACPIWVQLLLAVFCADFAQYWVHRAYHGKWLWRVHAIHHSAPIMDWLAGSRLHVVEIVATRMAVIGMLFWVGFEQPAIEAYVVWVGVQAVFAHANVGLDFGFLGYLLVTPRYHHWHHSDDPAAADKNFAVHLPILDMMFGTFRLPPGWPPSYGVTGMTVPDGFWRQMVFPLRRGFFRDS